MPMPVMSIATPSQLSEKETGFLYSYLHLYHADVLCVLDNVNGPLFFPGNFTDLIVR